MHKPARFLPLLAALALGLTGCAAGANPGASPEATGEAGPQRIAALTTDVSDLALELVGPERMVAVSEGSVTPGGGNQIDLATQVETHLSVTQNPDPEQILALDPDMVLLTGRHDDEQTLLESLAGAGVAVVSFAPSEFASPEVVADSIEKLGDALGVSEKAAEIASALRDDVAEVTERVAAAERKPKVLVLLARGGKALLMGTNSATTNLVELAGGESLAATHGWDAALPADPETIIAANPDIILVQDFRGAGLEPFTELLENPALAEVTAIAGNQVHLVDGATTSSSAGTRIDEGLAEIAALLHPELV